MTRASNTSFPKWLPLGALLACVLLVGSVTPGCRKSAPRTGSYEVARCEKGIERAIEEPTLERGNRVYYEECSVIYSEPACRDTFHGLPSVPAEERLERLVEACRKAYCPRLEERGELAACRPDFVTTRKDAYAAWAGLHNAILKHDAGGFAPRISAAMMSFYAQTQAWPASPSPE